MLPIGLKPVSRVWSTGPASSLFPRERLGMPESGLTLDATLLAVLGGD